MPNKAFCSFVLTPKSKNPVCRKCYYKYLSKRQNMLKIRHNQIRKSIPVRQKNSQNFYRILVYSYSSVPVENFQLEIPSWNFRLNIEKKSIGCRLFQSKVGDLAPELPSFGISCSESVK